MNTLYWHDYETWGATPSQDKPSQFAGIRTDEDLNIIGDPLVIYCKPSDDCLPHPEACLLTGITPQKALNDGLSEPIFFEKIHHELSQAKSCGVGYNSIRFDDEMTRYGLYRNFYDPYEREWQNGNSRWDIIDMVRLCYALRPDTLEWPINEKGAVSFKLELLSQANGLLHDAAHDALSDVYATIALAKLIKQREPQLYQYAYELRNKQKVNALIDTVSRKPILHISSRFPVSNGCTALVVPLAPHPENKNSVIVYDLSEDPTPLITCSAQEITERLYIKQSELSDGLTRIPLKEIHSNKSPMIATTKLLTDDAAHRLHIDKAQCERHWQQLQQVDITEKLHSVFSSQRFAPKVDPEQQLYDGFISAHDKQVMQRIRGAEPETLAHYSEELKDSRLKALLFRYRARHYPDTLTAEERQQWQEWRYLRLTDDNAGASITLDVYFERLSAYSDDPSVNQNIVRDLLDYGDHLLNEK
ncbi:exodeoxyribonuclease I [Eionea flava]